MGNKSKCLSINFSQPKKISKPSLWERAYDTGTHTFRNVLAPFFIIFQFRGTSLHGKLIGFPINIPWLGKMQQTASYEESLENWLPYFFPKYGCLHDILCIHHHMGKMLVLPISWSKQICSKTHPMGRVWKIDIHTFHKVWMSLFRQILILWDASSRWKCMGFSIISIIVRKICLTKDIHPPWTHIPR